MRGAMDSNVKTALILASIAAAFFIGVVIRHWIW
ncbi:MAG TPA: cytochrome oxidase small assembly protein [Burkholderiales bacterium]